ncbi:hypothetical protein RRG08_052469 [Elysia crispata]|uniref:Uncharacterized protein n=1 Tax=Elysia crispata TaxID=231223 RepID=A0AAE1B1C0_9GAST|nr:hypothetical protein RRG08_052469 [Elysia crispata]
MSQLLSWIDAPGLIIRPRHFLIFARSWLKLDLARELDLGRNGEKSKGSLGIPSRRRDLRPGKPGPGRVCLQICEHRGKIKGGSWGLDWDSGSCADRCKYGSTLLIGLVNDQSRSVKHYNPHPTVSSGYTVSGDCTRTQLSQVVTPYLVTVPAPNCLKWLHRICGYTVSGDCTRTQLSQVVTPYLVTAPPPNCLKWLHRICHNDCNLDQRILMGFRLYTRMEVTFLPVSSGSDRPTDLDQQLSLTVWALLCGSVPLTADFYRGILEKKKKYLGGFHLRGGRMSSVVGQTIKCGEEQLLLLLLVFIRSMCSAPRSPCAGRMVASRSRRFTDVAGDLAAIQRDGDESRNRRPPPLTVFGISPDQMRAGIVDHRRSLCLVFHRIR